MMVISLKFAPNIYISPPSISRTITMKKVETSSSSAPVIERMCRRSNKATSLQILDKSIISEPINIKKVNDAIALPCTFTPFDYLQSIK